MNHNMSISERNLSNNNHTFMISENEVIINNNNPYNHISNCYNVNINKY